MIDLQKFTEQLEKKLDSMTEQDWEDFYKASKKEIDYNHCEYCAQNDLKTCGKCSCCGVDGHIRSILFYTSAYCTECYKTKMKELDKLYD